MEPTGCRVYCYEVATEERSWKADLHKSQESNASKCPSSFLGAFTEFRKATMSFVMSVCPSVSPSAWNNSAPTGRIFVKVDIWIFFPKSVEKVQGSLQSNKNNGYFTWISIYIFDNISLSSSQNAKCFKQTCREIQNTHFVFNIFF